MTADVVPLSVALRARLARLGAQVPEASASARVPADGRVTTDQFFAFWEAIGASSPPDLGLRLANETQVHEYDVSSLAALHSPDLRTALEKIARYKRLCGPKHLALDFRKKDVRIHTTWTHASRPPPPRLVEASLASLLVLLQRGSGRPLAPRRIDLSRPRSDEPMLQRYFRCPLRFDADQDALVLDGGLLGTPFVTHNADVLEALLPSLEAKLAPASPPSFPDEVKAVISRRMSGERPSLHKVAREMALSTRTLQRRLGEHGDSYQQVLDEVRHEAALRLLKARELAISEIAFLLGFEELNSFTRAFNDWEGTTPKRWRDSMSDWRDPTGASVRRA